MTTKNTNKDFENFKEECLRLQEKWGLTDWKLYFGFEKDDNDAAMIADSDGCTARAYLSKNYREDTIEEIAKHEMLHLLLANLAALAKYRYITEQELKETEEKLVFRLEKIIK